MSKKVFELDFEGKKLIVEAGEIAKQADGAVLVRLNDTVVLSTACASDEAKDTDFFPLTVGYEEKQYAVGKIPGSFLRREGRPGEHATLTARLIDRPIRPMFSEGFRNEVQVVNTVMSVDLDSTPEMTAMFGASLALSISDIPFDGPIAGVYVGRVDGKFIINPSVEEKEKSDINLAVAGTSEAINMVEAGAAEVSEEDMLDAIMFGHEAIKKLCAFQKEIIKEIGKPKRSVDLYHVDEAIEKDVRDQAEARLKKSVSIVDKLERYAAIDAIDKEVLDKYEAKKYDNEKEKAKTIMQVHDVLETIVSEEVRRLITEEKVRPDGRKIDEIRPLDAQIDLLPRVHGSAMFTRGQTQVISVCTLGPKTDEQIIDNLTDEDSKRWMHHYNFPPYSVGEVGRMGTPGRREIGHGALGERALAQVMPSEEEFPYTVRVVSEILESNGSSSQATICAGCMSLMAAGVPIKAPVAGIAMGLITAADGKDYTILTDIQGMEDHLGDMDFKVGGTRKGICSLQIDIKIKGITKEILKQALAQAKEARMEILDVMEATIKEPRKEVSEYAPKTMIFTINPNKIKEVIGKGGEMITKIICEASNVATVNDMNAVKVELEDDGRVIIYHTNKDIINKTAEMIQAIAREVEEGKIYSGKVVKVEDFGCFVELWPGCEGLVHVSQLATERVEKPSDVVKVGDEIIVKAMGYDKKGRLNLSRKEVFKENKPKDNEKESD